MRRAIAQRPDHTAMEAAIVQGDTGAIAGSCATCLSRWSPGGPPGAQLHQVPDEFLWGPGFAMTGSGSAVYAIVPSFEYGAVLCTMLKDNYPQVFIAKSV